MAEVHKPKGCLKCDFCPANNPVMMDEVRELQFMVLAENEWIFWLGCSDVLVWGGRSG